MSLTRLWKNLRYLVLLPDDPGVKALALLLSIKRHQVYEMISQMRVKESEKFLEDLNRYHNDSCYIFSAARLFVLYAKSGPNHDSIWREEWGGDNDNLRPELSPKRQDLERATKLFNYLGSVLPGITD